MVRLNQANECLIVTTGPIGSNRQFAGEITKFQ
jgi:hypothetical protein